MQRSYACVLFIGVFIMVNTVETASVRDYALEFTDKIMPCVLDSQATKVYKLKPDETKLVSAIVAVAVNVYMHETCVARSNVDYVLTNDLKAMIKILQSNKTQIVSNTITTVLASVLNSSSAIQMIKYSHSDVSVQEHNVVRQKLCTVLVYSMWFYVHEYGCDYIAKCLRKLDTLATLDSFLMRALSAFVERESISVDGNRAVAVKDVTINDVYYDYDIVLQYAAKNIKTRTYIVPGTDLTKFLRMQYLNGTEVADRFSFCGWCICGLLYIPVPNNFYEKVLLNAECQAVIGACKDYINTHNMSELLFPFSHLWLSATRVKVAYTPAVYNTIVAHGGFSTEKSTRVKRTPVILQYITSKSNIAVATLYITPKALKLCEKTMRTYNSGQINEKSIRVRTSNVREPDNSCTGISTRFPKTVCYNGEEIPVPSQDIGFNKMMR